MSKSILIDLVNLVYSQLREADPDDRDIVAEFRTVSSLSRLGRVGLIDHLTILHSCYPIQVEETVIDVLKVLSRQDWNFGRSEAKELLYDTAILWLGGDADTDALDRMVAALHASGGFGDLNPSIPEEKIHRYFGITGSANSKRVEPKGKTR